LFWPRVPVTSNTITAMLSQRSEAAAAYDGFAPFYDEFNAQNDHEVWVGQTLLPELETQGLDLGRVLDVGCGTGKAFPPLLDRGWEVYGCDVSLEMLRRAEAKFDVPVLLADARELPDYAYRFDLVLMLNDVVNYLTEDGDLERCFRGVVKNLAPGGLVCFDANCLSLFEANWIAGRASALSKRGWPWKGLSDAVSAGGTFEAELAGEGVEAHRHRQRHWTREQVEAVLASCGLDRLAVLGQTENATEILLEDPPDEHRHYKTIYIGRARCRK
jgi:SAM-dependent methyltransferase